MGTSTDNSGFLDIKDTNGTVNVQVDADVGGATSANGRLMARSTGTGGPGGELALQNNNGGLRVQGLGGTSTGTSSLELFNVAGIRPT